MLRTERQTPSAGLAFARAWGATGILLLATACASVGPDYSRPDVRTPAGWSGQLEGGLTAAELDPASLSRWWEGLGDPLLSRFVETAIEANLDLRTADARLRQARAERALARGARFPTLGGRGSAVRSGEIASGGSSSELYSGGFDASWEIDVFDGQRRAIEATDADEQAAVESRRDVLVSVLAEVALNYVELRTFQRRLAIAEQNLKIQEDALGIVQAQITAGAASGVDLEQATSNVAATRAQIPSLSQNLSRAKNRISVLLGEAPGSRSEELRGPSELPVPPVEVALGVPADILRRRPDVRRAERQLAAETARVGVTTAELYPTFVLNGTIGIESLSLSGSRGLYNVGPEVTWRIFDGGRTRSKIEVQDAIQEQALIAYESALLEALEDVEDAITDFAGEQVRLRSLRESEEAATRAAALASTRYEAGASRFLEVLDAQRSLLSAADSRAASEGEVVSNVIRLYKALGGGWDSEEPGAEGI
jgi:NodT family efflux transporter outer membrane factor (OMF) lipoprotein